jgi:hypothetical protein
MWQICLNSQNHWTQSDEMEWDEIYFGGGNAPITYE